MGIFRASAVTAVATAARLLAGLVVIKLVAWYGGPEGVGRFGQFLSILSLLAVFGGGGIGSGVVKYIAEYRDRAGRLTRFIGVAVTFTIVAAIVISTLTIAFSGAITQLLFQDIEYQSLIFVMAAALPIIAANNLVIAIVNGHSDVRRVAVIYIVSSVITIGFSASLGRAFGVHGVMTGMMMGQAGAIFVSVPLLLRTFYFDVRAFRPRLDSRMLANLSHYSIMTLTSAVLPPLVSIWVRNHLSASFSWEEVGLWQAVSKVSEAYLLFFTMPISMYYLPKLSALADRSLIKREIRLAFCQLLPLVAGAALIIYLLRQSITLMLFSSAFYGADSLYAPQLLGDVVKIASFILSYLMLAKAMTGLFLASELFFSASYIGFVALLTPIFGLAGAVYAFALNYVLYFLFTLAVSLNYLGRK